MKVKIIAEGGNMQPGPAIAQQLGPMGINLGKVISDVNQATKGFKGMKVPVEIDVNTKTKEYTITLSSPPMSELIKKQLNLEKASGDSPNIKVGNLSIEEVISIAKTKLPSLLAKNLTSAVKMAVGSCVSLGVLIESKPAKEVMEEIAQGKYDKEIAEEKTEPSPEKKKKLDEFFAKLKAAQDKKQKELEAAKAAEEAAKAETAAATSAEEAKTGKPSPAAPTAPAPAEKKKE